MINGPQCLILKDGRCSLVVIRIDFVKQNRPLLNARKCQSEIEQSDKSSREDSHDIVVAASIQVDHRVYTLSWLVANSRCELILDTAWCMAAAHGVNYANHKVAVVDQNITIPRSAYDSLQVSNMRVKKFKSVGIEKCQKNDFEVSRFLKINHMKG